MTLLSNLLFPILIVLLFSGNPLKNLKSQPLDTILGIIIGLILSSTITYPAKTALHYFRYKHIPGPLIARLSPLWFWWITYRGLEARAIQSLHETYGAVILIAPNEVSVSDGSVLKTAYVQGGGYAKAPCYRNFDIDGHASLFSELERDSRLKRWKAVQGMFSSQAIARDAEVGIRGAVGRLVEVLRAERGKGRVDVLGPARAYALDAVSGYLFGRRYGALDELLRTFTSTELTGEKGGDGDTEISAGLFVDSFVAVGRFFYLPTWVFIVVEHLAARFAKDKTQVETSMLTVDGYVASVVEEAELKTKESGGEEENSYQARLLKAGISPEETRAQCKDLMFAGTDSTGMNLATACFYLSKDPERYYRLHKELTDNPTASPFTLPYLTNCIKEALRLSMANPTRMPRVVPSSGLTIPTTTTSSIFLPKSTIIGLQPYTLHHNASIFPSPHSFIPERWEDPSPEMMRDWIPFGLGSRACVARNVAMVELVLAVEGIVRDGVLEGLKGVEDRIEILEWFNSKVIGGRIELENGEWRE